MTSLIVTIALWAITLWRLPSAQESRRKGALWLAFAATAVAMTLRIDPIETAIDTGTGVAGLSLLLKHYAGLVSGTSVLDFVDALTSRDDERRRFGAHHGAAAITAVTLTVIFAAMSRPGSSDFIDHAVGQPLPTAYLVVFSVYFATAMATATVRFWQARGEAHRMLRIGLTVLACGAALCAAYAGLRTGFLLTRLARPLPGGDDAWIAASDGLKNTGMLLIMAGCTLPAAELTARHCRYLRTLHQLRPLWATITATTPEIVLDRPNRLHDLADPRDLRMRVVRRVGEIHDAALLLRGWTDTDRPQAIAALRGADLGVLGVEAASEAVLLRIALANRNAATPDSPAPSTNTYPLLSGGDDLDAELTWLCHVTHAYHHPAVIRASDALLASPLTAR
jgi:hypothetical protein